MFSLLPFRVKKKILATFEFLYFILHANCLWALYQVIIRHYITDDARAPAFISANYLARPYAGCLHIHTIKRFCFDAFMAFIALFALLSQNHMRRLWPLYVICYLSLIQIVFRKRLYFGIIAACGYTDYYFLDPVKWQTRL